MFCVFNYTATTEIYTLSLHDALPISHQIVPLTEERADSLVGGDVDFAGEFGFPTLGFEYSGLQSADLGVKILEDRKSTRLNSSHANISYAVFCLKKKHKNISQISNLV